MLPGHGTSPEDLAAHGWDDWSAAAEEAYQVLAARCRSVVAVGLSMGGALAAWVAAAHPEVLGLAVVNPLVDPPAPEFRQVLKAFLDAGEHFLPGVGGDIADPGGHETAYDRLPVAALLSMSVGLEALRPRLADIRCPVLVLTSRHDHVVPVASTELLAAAVSGPVERVWLERSYHVATVDYDSDELERRVVEFASELGRAPHGQEEAGDHDARGSQQGQGAGH